MGIGVILSTSIPAFSLPVESKTVTQTKTSSSNDLPNSIYYDDGTYVGVLTGQGVTKTLISGSPADSKIVTGVNDAYGNWIDDGRTQKKKKWGVWSWANGSWIPRGTLDQPQHDEYMVHGWTYVQLDTDYLWLYPLSQNYRVGEYSGIVYRQSDPAFDIQPANPEPPRDGGFQIMESYWSTWYYTGTVSKPDTRVYKYSQNYSGTVTLKASDIKSNPVSISGNEYTNNNIYWVQPNNQFSIKISGSTATANSDYKINSLHAIMKDETNSQINFNGYVNNSQNTSSNGTTTNSSVLMQLISTSVNRTSSTNTEANFSAKITQDNKTYYIYPLLRLYQDGDYTDPTKLLRETTLWEDIKKAVVKSDGVAPNGIVDCYYDNVTSDMSINVSNVVEIGSGVKRIWAEYSLNDSQLNVVEEDLKNNNGIYKGGKNLQDLFNGNADTVNVKVKAIDNVGNERTLLSKDTDVFTLNANIVRVLDPHDPIFKSGEKGILKINVTGGVDRINITFPTELSSLDDTLNKEITLTPQKADSIDYEFFIPLETEMNSYNVQVKAYKKDKEKVVYPPFSVTGNILDELKTRIRLMNR